MARTKLPPTVRQRRLGAELRRLRESAELSATQAGELFGATQSRISNIEAGGYAVSADRVRALTHLYGCTDDELIEALTGMTGGRTRGWWEEYREILPAGMLDLAELEHHATYMRNVSVFHMPGVLQTTEHARALISDALPALALHEVEHRVSFRIKRQAVLYGDQPTPLTAVVHEAALRMGFGGPAVAQAQLDYLIKMSERDNITLKVIPFGTGIFPISGQGIIYFGGDVSGLDTVQLDADHGSEFLDTRPQLAHYRAIVDRMEACALAPAESRDAIRRIAQNL
ncbi:helix-turn-helix transcriptional regulator [Streptomyces sp. NPDC019937]|uniref:helix-turn-helix domain-containing protein n=1 Tax=Streptomyces sp. NPDC019937 TaxID=3154787 RepID=UPI0033FFE9B6